MAFGDLVSYCMWFIMMRMKYYCYGIASPPKKADGLVGLVPHVDPYSCGYALTRLMELDPQSLNTDGLRGPSSVCEPVQLGLCYK